MTSVDKDVKKLKPLYATGGDVKWCIHFKTVWQFVKRWNIALLYDLAILPKRDKNICPQKILDMYVYNSIIYNTQKVETTAMSIN